MLPGTASLALRKGARQHFRRLGLRLPAPHRCSGRHHCHCRGHEPSGACWLEYHHCRTTTEASLPLRESSASQRRHRRKTRPCRPSRCAQVFISQLFHSEVIRPPNPKFYVGRYTVAQRRLGLYICFVSSRLGQVIFKVVATCKLRVVCCYMHCAFALCKPLASGLKSGKFQISKRKLEGAMRFAFIHTKTSF